MKQKPVAALSMYYNPDQVRPIRIRLSISSCSHTASRPIEPFYCLQGISSSIYWPRGRSGWCDGPSRAPTPRPTAAAKRKHNN